MINENVTCLPGVLTVYGESLAASGHQHQALQLIWPDLASVCTLKVEGEAVVTGSHNGFLIQSNIEHELVMCKGWVILIEPQSLAGMTLAKYLQQRSVASLNLAGVTCPQPATNLAQCLQPIFDIFNINAVSLLSSTNTGVNCFGTPLDKRIEQLLHTLNACFDGECLKPDKWLAHDIAEGLGLSESRFLHLFKHEMGLPWRPYLLWRRLLCAIKMLSAETSATEAAHLAGFADSAHLSRTFKRLFGMTIRDALRTLS